MPKPIEDAIRTIENLASEPLFGGQKERLDDVLKILRELQTTETTIDGLGWNDDEMWNAFVYWRDRFSLGHPGRSQFMELTDDDRKQLYALFLKLAGPQR